MNSQSGNIALLPSGFEDLLPQQARAEFKAIADLMDVFSRFGYTRVKPPLAEFEDSLLSPGPGAALSADTFRVMDPESRRMMALRSDITAQIARIAMTRLNDVRPLRVSYANDVIRTRGSQQRTQRQFCQIGCELIGVESVAADIETCVLVLIGLHRLGLKGISLDFAVPHISQDVLLAANPDGRALDEIRHDLAGPVDQALCRLEALPLSNEVECAVKRLRMVIEGVQDALDDLGIKDVLLTLDPLETQGFEYHSGIAFAVFAEGARGEVGRGGRYKIYDQSEHSEHACGFTLYADAVRRGLPECAEADVKHVDQDMRWSDIMKLQDDGHITVRNYE